MSFRCRIDDQAKEILLRGFQTAGLDPGRFAVRIRLVRGVVQTSFVEHPEPGDEVVDAAGVRLFVDPSITASGSVAIEGSSEHQQITVAVLGDP